MARLNRVIELWEQGQPVFAGGVATLTYEAGRQAAGTELDLFIVDFEHHPFDMIGLRALLKGLAEAGPTRSGHRMPPVVATLPVTGTSAEAIWSNAWQIGHLLAAGVYGILLCHAESPAAVKAFVEATRWAFAQVGRDRLEVGRRGGGGQGYAAQIWGVPVAEYMAKSDPWPLNPKGELILGLKIENRRALANVETSLTVPGIAFAEWGPGDMGMSLGDVDYYLPGDDHRPNPDFGHDPPYGPIMQAAQERVARACRQNGVVFYSTMREVDWRRHYDLGSRASSASPQTVPIIELIRRHAGRTMPV